MKPSPPESGLLLKATPPRSPKDAIPRARLASDAAAFADRTAIAVEAPAGFGKTSLLTQWRREWLARGAVVAWLTLDERDDVARFIDGLAAAMRVAAPRGSFEGGGSSTPSAGSPEIDRLTSWLAAVAAMTIDTVLVLDDAHLLPKRSGEEALLYIVRNAPSNLRVLIASRGPLGLPVADLVAHGDFAVVTVDQLRFTLDETVAVLNARFGSRLDADRSARLHEITEGWPLGLQLAVGVLRNETVDLAGAIDKIARSAGDIERYFAANLVAALAPEQTDLLVKLSIVDDIHPSLAVALTGDEDAPYALAQLAATAPIFIDSAESPWTRIHPLARQFLQARFAALPEATRRSVHERALDWLEEAGLFEQAARHALAAGLEARAWELVERQLYQVMLSGHTSRVLDWIQRVPMAEVEKRHGLRIAVAWGLALGERHTESRRLLDIDAADPTDDAAARCETAMISSAAAFYADDIDSSVATIGPWLEAPPDAPPRLHAMLANQSSALALFRGQPERARYLHLRAPRYESPTGYDQIRGFGEWIVGLSYLWEGQAALAEGVLRESQRVADRQVGRRNPVAVMQATALATALWDRNLTSEAALVLADRLDAVERVAAPEGIVMGYVAAARLASLHRDERRSIDLLQNLYALGEARASVRMRVVALAEQVRLHSLARRVETAAALLNRLQALVPPGTRASQGILAPRIQLAADIASAQEAIARDDPTASLTALESAARIAERLRRGKEAIEIKLLRAVALRARGEDAALLLAEARSLMESYGLARLAQDTHPSLEPAPAAAPVAAPTPTAAAQGVLTPKEQKVLGLVARNLSNKQIALALDIGDETVKWHLKNLFSKLNAGTRDHLVLRARMLGLLAAA